MELSLDQQNSLLQAAISEVLKKNGNRVVFKVDDFGSEDAQLLFEWSKDLTEVTITRISENSKVVN